jgi:hypothetical protein
MVESAGRRRRGGRHSWSDTQIVFTMPNMGVTTGP